MDLFQALVIISSRPSLVTYLNRTPMLSGVWVDVDRRMDTQKTSCVEKRLDYVLKNC